MYALHKNSANQKTWLLFDLIFNAITSVIVLNR